MVKLAFILRHLLLFTFERSMKLSILVEYEIKTQTLHDLSWIFFKNQYLTILCQVATGQVASTGMVALSYVQKVSEKVNLVQFMPCAVICNVQYFHVCCFCLFAFRFLQHQTSCTTICLGMSQPALVTITSFDR